MANRLPEDLVQFIRLRLGSVWALELLLLLHGQPDSGRTIKDLVRDLRATETLVSALLRRLLAAGLVAQEDDGRWCWRPIDIQTARFAERVAQAYRATPFAVVQIIAESPVSPLLEFAAAFRLRKD